MAAAVPESAASSKSPPTSPCSQPQSTWPASACSGSLTETAPGRQPAADTGETAGKGPLPAPPQSLPRPSPAHPGRPEGAQQRVSGRPDDIPRPAAAGLTAHEGRLTPAT